MILQQWTPIFMRKENEAKVQKMRDDGKDPYDIRKQEEVPL